MPPKLIGSSAKLRSAFKVHSDVPGVRAGFHLMTYLAKSAVIQRDAQLHEREESQSRFSKCSCLQLPAKKISHDADS